MSETPTKPTAAAADWPIAQVVGVAMLAWALVPSNPYGYYILLRVVLCGICLYLAWRAYQRGRSGWVWTLAIIAVVYNPVFRIHMTREIWSVVNVATMTVLVLSIWSFTQGKHEPKPHET